MNGKAKAPKYARFAYKTGGRAALFKMISDIAVGLTVVIYVSCAIALVLNKPLFGGGFVLISGLSFAVLTLSRKLIDAKRPYELYDILEIAPELSSRRGGVSFPSRHVFSSFLIGTMLLPLSWQLGVIALSLGVLISVLRVLLLIHFPRDVIAGAVIGVIAGVIGMSALKFII